MKNINQFSNLLIVVGILFVLMATGCSSLPTARDTFKLYKGMTEIQVVEVMGEPEQRTDERMLYTVKYNCTEVPFYVVTQMGFVVKAGAAIPTALIDRKCAEREQSRLQALSQLNSAAKLMQNQFGPRPDNQREEPMQPLMRNCWTDAAGMHCM